MNKSSVIIQGGRLTNDYRGVPLTTVGAETSFRQGVRTSVGECVEVRMISKVTFRRHDRSTPTGSHAPDMHNMEVGNSPSARVAYPWTERGRDPIDTNSDDTGCWRAV